MNIFIVEQHRHFLESLKRYLEQLGHTVYTAFDGVIAVNDFKDDFDVLFIDNDIPRISCHEVIELLKKKKESLRIFVLLDDFIVKKDDLLDSKYVDDFIHRPFIAKDIDKALECLKKKKIDGYTNIEAELIELLKRNASFDELDKLISPREELEEYKQAVKEKGFKLDKEND